VIGLPGFVAHHVAEVGVGGADGQLLGGLAKLPLGLIVSSEDEFRARSLLGVVTKVSPWSVADNVTWLAAVVDARKMKMFAVIDHQQGHEILSDHFVPIPRER
jgi:hypothetical protein